MRTNDEKITLTHEEVAQIAFLTAGVGSGAVMMEAPDVVMPDEKICEGVADVLREYGVDVTTLHGYGQAVPA